MWQNICPYILGMQHCTCSPFHMQIYIGVAAFYLLTFLWKFKLIQTNCFETIRTSEFIHDCYTMRFLFETFWLKNLNTLLHLHNWFATHSVTISFYFETPVLIPCEQWNINIASNLHRLNINQQSNCDSLTLSIAHSQTTSR